MKFLKLVNDENKLTLMKSAKACGTNDRCEFSDLADCSLGATDTCKYDYASCRGDVYDTCGSNIIDRIGCMNQSDFT